MKYTHIMMLFGLCCLLVLEAQAALQVKPTRLLVTDQQRATCVAVKNLSAEKRTYRVSLVFYRMDGEGAVTQVEKPREDERPALGMFRYSPHRMVLLPGAEQVVRIMVQKKANLPEADCRAHNLLSEVEDIDSLKSPGGDIKDTQVSMQLEPRVGMAAVDGVSSYLNRRIAKYPLSQNRVAKKGKFRLEFLESDDEDPKVIDAIEIDLG